MFFESWSYVNKILANCKKGEYISFCDIFHVYGKPKSYSNSSLSIITVLPPSPVNQVLKPIIWMWIFWKALVEVTVMLKFKSQSMSWTKVVYFKFCYKLWNECLYSNTSIVQVDGMSGVVCSYNDWWGTAFLTRASSVIKSMFPIKIVSWQLLSERRKDVIDTSIWTSPVDCQQFTKLKIYSLYRLCDNIYGSCITTNESNLTDATIKNPLWSWAFFLFVSCDGGRVNNIDAKMEYYSVL